MKPSADAWYSLLSFRKQPIGLVLVAHNREWGRVELVDPLPKNVHPAAAQFIRSTVGSLRKRLEREDVPLKRDLDYIATRMSGEVRLSMPLPVTGPSPEDIFKRVWRNYLSQAA